MLRYLLDTNIVIYVIKRRPIEVLSKFNANTTRTAISATTLAELMHGAEKSSQRGHQTGVGRRQVVRQPRRSAHRHQRITLRNGLGACFFPVPVGVTWGVGTSPATSALAAGSLVELIQGWVEAVGRCLAVGGRRSFTGSTGGVEESLVERVGIVTHLRQILRQLREQQGFRNDHAAALATAHVGAVGAHLLGGGWRGFGLEYEESEGGCA